MTDEIANQIANLALAGNYDEAMSVLTQATLDRAVQAPEPPKLDPQQDGYYNPDLPPPPAEFSIVTSDGKKVYTPGYPAGGLKVED